VVVVDEGRCVYLYMHTGTAYFSKEEMMSEG
jgi:hypothetical protein